MAVSCRTDCVRTLYSYFSDEFLRISDFKPLCAFYWDLSLHLDSVGKHLRLRFTLFLFLFFLEEHFMFLDVRLYFFSRSCALFTGSVSILFRKKKIKLSPSVLSTHLKIILLQCFQFSAK